MTVFTKKTGDEQQTSQVLFFMAVFADMHLSQTQLVLTNSVH